MYHRQNFRPEPVEFLMSRDFSGTCNFLLPLSCKKGTDLLKVKENMGMLYG
jgi:hypothetical protein